MDLSKIIDFESLKIDLPEIKMPLREGSCPASPICEALGNLDSSCLDGGPTNLGSKDCIVSLILLLSRTFGIWPPQMVEEIEKRRIGFDLSAKQE